MKFAIFLFFLCFISCNSNQGDKFIQSKTKNGRIVATVNYKFEGCFGGAAHKLIIVDENGQKTAILTSDDGISDDDTPEFAKLDDAKLDSFYRFIKELKEIEFSFGCTTTSYYTVVIGREKIKKTDGGCDWAGFDNLRTALFKK